MPVRERLGEQGTVYLDAGPQASGRSRSLLFTQPVRIIKAHTLAEVRTALAEVDRWQQAGKWLAGFIAYEAGFAFTDQPLTKPLNQPLAWFGVYGAPLEGDIAEVVEPVRGPVLQGSRFGLSREAYADVLRRIKEHIYEGDVYQINFTDAIAFQTQRTASELFTRLRQRQQAAYGAFINLGDQQIVSLSPELFFERDGDRLRTRPMKGTIHRGKHVEEDETLRQQLASDEKNRAENLMIVDLLRNDLSRVCVPGSVQVPQLFDTEVYPTLIQMTSTVEGRLQPNISYVDLFEALFPCGSITGAPKIRAMQIIDALEREARGVYCGAIGYIAPEQKAMFNVAIRTLTLQEGEGRMGVGSGIVWDSDVDAEYEECQLKARFLHEEAQAPAAFDLIETMLWDDEIALLPYHLDRLQGSARYFKRPFVRPVMERAILEACVDLVAPTKVRLLVHPSGLHTLTTTPLPRGLPFVRSIKIASKSIDSRDVFFYHKTTRRALYDDAFQEAQAEGFDEVLFLNERGELAEGSRTNLFIRRGDALLTPPLACGVLPGVYRRYVLETFPNVSERVLHLEDLLTADAMYLTNAVHGWQEATWMPLAETARAVE